MNRSLFTLFFMYFFVVQSAIFGFVRWEPKFYIIGLINLIFIILMVIFYKNFDTSTTLNASLYAGRKESKSPIGIFFVISIILLFLVVLDKSFFGILPVSIWWFAALYFVLLFLSAKKLLDKKIYIGNMLFLPKDFLFWTSLIVVMWVYGTLQLEVISFKILLSVVVWFIFFFIGGRIVKETWSFSIFQLFFTRLYVIVLLVVGIWLGLQSSMYDNWYRLSSDWETIKRLVNNSFLDIPDQNPSEIFTWNDLLSNGNWQVLSSSMSSSLNTWQIYQTSDQMSWDGNFGVEDSWTLVSVPVPVVAPENDDRLSVPSLPTLMDVLIYLTDHYNVDLTDKKDIKFTYVSAKNPYYAEFRTAYDMKLIWYSANPSKHVLCETYIVMKWIVEEWTISSTENIVSASWKEAVSRWVTNGCKKGYYVKNVNL